ncbi:MAG: hypothetical protein J0L55_09000 [Caulobacterales bacterium]|nr:hypothetical protein [Caulobacterales bacterium]MCA0372315.1 hypothetical protein [Pseudomonadota bacterium]
MKTGIKYFAIAIASFSCINVANAQSVLREMNEKAQQNEVKIISPKLPFDEATTRNMLETGNINIQGVLYTRTASDGSDAPLLNVGAKAVPAANQRVHLYPVTPYYQEFIGLVKKYRFYRGKQKISIEPDIRVHELHYYAQTDEYGRFTFYNMKPGRYMIYADKQVKGSYNETVATGRSVSDFNPYYGQVGVTKYENQTRYWSAIAYAEKFIELKPDDKVLEIDVRMLQNPDHPILKNVK